GHVRRAARAQGIVERVFTPARRAGTHPAIAESRPSGRGLLGPGQHRGRAHPQEAPMTRRPLAALILWGLPALALAARPSPWNVVASPNRGTLSNALNGVSVAPDGTAWAVGHWYDQNLASYRTLTLRTAGGTLNTVASPNVGNGYHDLLGVARSPLPKPGPLATRAPRSTTRRTR